MNSLWFRIECLLCCLLVLNLQSSALENSPRFIVHCIQLVPEKSFKAFQFDKYISIPELVSSNLTFSVLVRFDQNLNRVY